MTTQLLQESFQPNEELSRKLAKIFSTLSSLQLFAFANWMVESVLAGLHEKTDPSPEVKNLIQLLTPPAAALDTLIHDYYLLASSHKKKSKKSRYAMFYIEYFKGNKALNQLLDALRNESTNGLLTFLAFSIISEERTRFQKFEPTGFVDFLQKNDTDRQLREIEDGLLSALYGKPT